MKKINNAEMESMKGLVKWFDDKKGYGFIVVDNFEQKIFVHFSQIKAEGFKSLKENDYVVFEYNAEKNCAENVIKVSEEATN